MPLESTSHLSFTYIAPGAITSVLEYRIGDRHRNEVRTKLHLCRYAKNPTGGINDAASFRLQTFTKDGREFRTENQFHRERWLATERSGLHYGQREVLTPHYLTPSTIDIVRVPIEYSDGFIDKYQVHMCTMTGNHRRA